MREGPKIGQGVAKQSVEVKLVSLRGGVDVKLERERSGFVWEILKIKENEKGQYFTFYFFKSTFFNVCPNMVLNTFCFW